MGPRPTSSHISNYSGRKMPGGGYIFLTTGGESKYTGRSVGAFQTTSYCSYCKQKKSAF